MADKNDFIPPKINRYDKIGEGQGFNHEVPTDRSWDQVLDAVHSLLRQKWYYVAIATNTKRGMFGRITDKKINLTRKKKEVPEELKELLRMKLQTFNELKGKIIKKALDTGDKDVWHFTNKWKEFPKGTSVIELRQRSLMSLFKDHFEYRRAFIILDGECTIDHQNQTMLIVNKVLKNKTFTKETIQKSRKEPVQEAKPKQRKSTIYEGRPPGELVVMLKGNFMATVRTMTIDERSALEIYLDKLKKSGEHNTSHQDLEKMLKIYFKDMFQK